MVQSSRNSKGLSKLPIIQLVLPYKINKGSSETPLLTIPAILRVSSWPTCLKQNTHSDCDKNINKTRTDVKSVKLDRWVLNFLAGTVSSQNDYSMGLKTWNDEVDRRIRDESKLGSPVYFCKTCKQEKNPVEKNGARTLFTRWRIGERHWRSWLIRELCHWWDDDTISAWIMTLALKDIKGTSELGIVMGSL